MPQNFEYIHVFLCDYSNEGLLDVQSSDAVCFKFLLVDVSKIIVHSAFLSSALFDSSFHVVLIVTTGVQ